MKDETTTVAELKELLVRFVRERAWEKYHRPKELATAMMTEAAELVENFQWHNDAEVEALAGEADFRERISDEIADVLAFLLLLANRVGIDVASSVEAKMKKNEEKYPVERYHGRYERPERGD